MASRASVLRRRGIRNSGVVPDHAAVSACESWSWCAEASWLVSPLAWKGHSKAVFLLAVCLRGRRTSGFQDAEKGSLWKYGVPLVAPRTSDRRAPASPPHAAATPPAPQQSSAREPLPGQLQRENPCVPIVALQIRWRYVSPGRRSFCAPQRPRRSVRREAVLA